MRKEESLRAAILKYSSLHFRWLLFPPSLERTYRSEANTFRSKRQWLEGLLCIGLYVLFATARELQEPRPLHTAWLRFGVIIPVTLFVNMGMLTRLSSGIKDAGILTASCVAGTVEIWLSRAHGPVDDAFTSLIIVAVFVFANTVMRIRIAYGAAALGWGIVAEGLSLYSRRGEPITAHLLPSFIVLAIGMLTLTANYSQNREARLAFLRQTEKDELVGTLARSNEDLAVAALTDTLTGLPNRSALNARLDETWASLAQSDSVCSVVMVDIDHFKGLNDRYGHLYGDRVLRRVARLLAEALRGEDDFIARFGGEEFVVILPRTSGPLARIVAERLRGLVELAGLPSVRSGDPSLLGMRATISCGVAVASPRLEPDPYALLEVADRFLYRAKREGRNLVRGGEAVDDRSTGVAATDASHVRVTS